MYEKVAGSAQFGGEADGVARRRALKWQRVCQKEE